MVLLGCAFRRRRRQCVVLPDRITDIVTAAFTIMRPELEPNVVLSF